MPSSGGDPARGLLCRVSPPRSTLRPPERSAAKVGPRASIDTAHPARSRASPIQAPMAPAPTMATDGLMGPTQAFAQAGTNHLFGCRLPIGKILRARQTTKAFLREHEMSREE